MDRKYTLLFVFLWLLTTVTAQDILVLLDHKETYTVGTTITLAFENKTDNNYQLFCSNSYGNTIIHGSKHKNKLRFTIPQFISNKIGMVNWKILGTKENHKGQFFINPVQQPTTLETYIGPPTIEAGGTDYTMLVVIPTDTLDNPIQNNSKVIVKQQFLSSQKKQTITTQDFISYLNIFSPLPSGRMTLSTESYKLNSKEYTIDILPAIGSNFKIFHKRNHSYADGNQITTFFTSIIRDKNNNIVSDGTFVSFFITTENGNILKTNGTTINGIATASIIHPDCETTWEIKGYIDGISESDTIKITFEKVIETLPLTFSKDNRNITVGPLQSFMKQIIPDGLQIKLTIYQNGKTQETIIEQSKDGFASFTLNPNIYKNGTYDIEITAACIVKTYKAIVLW